MYDSRNISANRYNQSASHLFQAGQVLAANDIQGHHYGPISGPKIGLKDKLSHNLG